MNKHLEYICGFFSMKRRNCSVPYRHVDFHAIKGHNITVCSGSYVDKRTKIGSYSYIGRSCSITSTEVGRYVSIGNNVSIGQGEHKLTNISTSSIFYDDPYEELTRDKCVIESDVWIGVDAIILRGVNLGLGCVVAANAVVTKDVPPYAVVAGVPAKIIKFRFDEDMIKKISDSKWWELDSESASHLLKKIATGA